MSASIQSFNDVVSLSIKYQLECMKVQLVENLSKFKGTEFKSVIPVCITFYVSKAESNSITRATAKFFFDAFGWMTCRTNLSESELAELPAKSFSSYSVSIFVDNSKLVADTVDQMMSKLNSLVEKLWDVKPTRPILTRCGEMNSCVSQRVSHEPHCDKLSTKEGAVTIETVENPKPKSTNQPINPDNIIEEIGGKKE